MGVQSQFLAQVVDNHFIRLARVKFKVIIIGPLGDVVKFIVDQ